MNAQFLLHDLSAAVAANSWEYLDSDTQHLTHGIHRYSGKFIPQIAERAISLLTSPGELVIDPYCGSGTTLVEAAMLNRRALGVDLNPLAVLIARTKTRPVSSDRLERLQRDLRAALGGGSPVGELFKTSLHERASNDARLGDEWYKKWFQPHVLQQLVAIHLAISDIEDQAERNVATIAFSEILRRSSNAHSGYPNVMFDKNAPEKPSPARAFFKALNRVAEMVASLESTPADWKNVNAIEANATAIPVETDSVDAVVTHPPYIGSIPYAEYGSLSLTWMGVDPKALDRELTGGRRQSKDVVDRFATGYASMLKESARILKPGRFAFLMVGNPVVKGELIDLSEMTVELATTAGLRLVSRTVREGVNRRANKMGAEHLLFFQKT